MQKVTIKFLTFGLLFLLALTSRAQEANPQALLNEADSLYSQKKFTESLKIYKEVFQQEIATPAMLLKMARIEEAMNNKAMAIYYLTKHYNLTADEKVLDKISQMAEKNELEGYAFNDFFRISYYYQQFLPLLQLVLSGVLLVLVALLYKKRTHKEARTVLGVFSLLLIVGLGVTNNLPVREKAIINQNTYLMAGPSAGAEVVDALNAGHKITIKGQQDVWTETSWNGQKAYIKTGHFRKL